MGKLIDGVWHDVWYDTKSTDGRFVRKESQFRDWITPGGDFPPEAGRYHLYVSLACPWANRTLILRKLKGLEEMIGVTVVDPIMLENGWEFSGDTGPVQGLRYLHQLYTLAEPAYTGRVTVPVLWDTARGTIVSNESAEILRMFNSAFDGAGAQPGDYYPKALRERIDQINEPVLRDVNNGVYKAGFATTQAAYEEAFEALFATLDRLETRLSGQRYLLGDQITEADWRLFTTLVRFDPVYVTHFKCNKRRIADYPALSAYLRDLYQVPGIAGTCDMEHIKTHYFTSHRSINPHGIVPRGPDVDLTAPHGRETLGEAAA